MPARRAMAQDSKRSRNRARSSVPRHRSGWRSSVVLDALAREVEVGLFERGVSWHELVDGDALLGCQVGDRRGVQTCHHERAADVGVHGCATTGEQRGEVGCARRADEHVMVAR